MSENGNTWQIIHIPDKPPIPPNQQPTVNVYASVIEPKLTNTLIRRLNQIAPLEDLRHLKRVQKKYSEGGKTQLSVILCLASENESEMNDMPQGVQELINSYQLSAFITKVYKYAALSKEEWEEQCKLWPTSYHPPTYDAPYRTQLFDIEECERSNLLNCRYSSSNIDGITGFSKEDSQSIYSFMRFAINMAKSGDGSIGNVAVIVDPSVKQVIASACDQIHSWYPMNQSSNQITCSQTDAGPHPDIHGPPSSSSLHSNDSFGTPQQSYIAVSCLNPWLWPEQSPYPSSCYWHPLRHAALVAIESSASRDRHLFPGLEYNGDEVDEMNNMQSLSMTCENSRSLSIGSPLKRHKTNHSDVENNGELDASTKDLHSISVRPYLCTGYDIYLVWEPCVMCAMALVHQRIRRIFYAFPNANAGALGSVHRLQGEKSLNHHYAVFRVLLPEKVLYEDEVGIVNSKDC